MDVGFFLGIFNFPERDKHDETDKNDSVWATISGVIRTYTGFTLDYVLYDLSYANLIMLNSVIPSYKSSKDKKKRQRRQKDKRR